MKTNQTNVDWITAIPYTLDQPLVLDETVGVRLDGGMQDTLSDCLGRSDVRETIISNYLINK